MSEQSYIKKIMQMLKEKEYLTINKTYNDKLELVNNKIVSSEPNYNTKLSEIIEEREKDIQSIKNNPFINEEGKDMRIKRVNDNFSYTLMVLQQNKISKDQELLNELKQVQKLNMYQFNIYSSGDNFNELTIEDVIELYDEFKESIDWKELSMDGSFPFSSNFYRMNKDKLYWKEVALNHQLTADIYSENEIRLKPYLNLISKNKNIIDENIKRYFKHYKK